MSRARFRILTALTVGAALILAGAQVALAATITSVAFSGGAGTALVGSTLYAKSGATVTLTVVTDSSTRCVQVSGAHADRQTSSVAKTSWVFTFSADPVEGVRGVTVTAGEGFNANNCSTKLASTQASYTVDNTGPVVTATLSPAPNAAGWNKSNVGITWSATDAGSGIATGPTPATDSQSGPTSGVAKTSTATDRVGNVGTGSVTVKLDQSPPSISAAQTSNPDGTTTIAFTCSDGSGPGVSGIASCLASGSQNNVRTVGPNTTVTGTATDSAGNTASVSSTSPAGDTTPPTLSGTPTTSPNGAGWYKNDVTIHWTCADNAGGSGLAPGACPADDTISSEGQNLTVSRPLTDIAGNTTTATSAPAVKIDKTAPTTSITGGSNAWTKDSVNVQLSASDNVSGVDSTTYSVDGGAAQTGTSFTLSTEGDHTVTFSSRDAAGNVEATNTAHVKIDRMAPTLGHVFDPVSYVENSWTNQNVTVTFACADAGSGVASCTAPATLSGEGTHSVVGTATDNAGNSATDTAYVRIDKTAPTITAVVTGVKNAHGWYKDDVVVSYTTDDDRSGVVLPGPGSDVLGEGENQSAGATVYDAAGNSASASVSDIDVDKTPPVLTASFTPGWHTDDVAVDWSCTDVLSGVDLEPSDDLVTGEGANLGSSASCTDNAGNTATETVDGIKIDRTPPGTEASVADPLASGWYDGPVQVTLTGTDTLSGVAATYYTIDGGATHTYSAPFPVSSDGEHTVAFWSVDGAGHVEHPAGSVEPKIDTTAPTTSVTDPTSPASGWFMTSGVPFAFDATDAGSGIAATYYTIDGGTPLVYGEPFTRSLSDGPHTVEYWSVDLAGNTEPARSLTLQVDATAPTITGAITGGTLGANGWYTSAVTVSFTCADSGSGVAGCTGPVTLSTDDSSNSATGTATDKAGNTASTKVEPIKIDTVNPTASFNSSIGSAYYGAVPAEPTCTSSDSGSGPDGCTVSGYSTDVGTHTLTATAKDKAGRTGTATIAYTVLPWTAKGFYQPVDMTPMNTLTASPVYNSVKGGSTVPVKFEVFRDTTELTGTDVVDLSARKVTCSSSATLDTIELTTTGNTSLRYDSTAGQFIYNWKTPTGAGTCYQLTMTADDGSTLSAYFRMK